MNDSWDYCSTSELCRTPPQLGSATGSSDHRVLPSLKAAPSCQQVAVPYKLSSQHTRLCTAGSAITTDLPKHPRLQRAVQQAPETGLSAGILLTPQRYLPGNPYTPGSAATAQPKNHITFISTAVPPPPCHRAMHTALLYNPSWVPQSSLSHEAGVTPAVPSAQHHRGAQLPSCTCKLCQQVTIRQRLVSV